MILDRICHLWDPIFLDEIWGYLSKFFPSLAVCDWYFPMQIPVYFLSSACILQKEVIGGALFLSKNSDEPNAASPSSSTWSCQHCLNLPDDSVFPDWDSPKNTKNYTIANYCFCPLVEFHREIQHSGEEYMVRFSPSGKNVDSMDVQQHWININSITQSSCHLHYG